MKRLILGGYSYYSLLKDEKTYKEFFDKQVVPLLKLLYDNPEYKFSFYLTGSEIEWIADNREDVLRVIAILLKRGSISLLSAPFYQCFTPVATIKNVVEQTEYMRLRIRQLFKYKPKGLFVFNGLWQTDLIKPYSRAEINYALLPTATNKVGSPFVMSEYGKKIVILPSCCAYSTPVTKYLSSALSFEKFATAYAKEIDRKSAYQSFFFNIDDFQKSGKDFPSFIKALYGVYKSVDDLGFFTTDEINDVDNVSYLPSGCYADEGAFLQKLYSNPESLLRISRIQYIDNIFTAKIQKRGDFDSLTLPLMKMLEGTQFLQNYSDKPLQNEIYKNYLQSLIALFNPEDCPDFLDMVSYSFMLIKSKGYMALMDYGDAVVKELGDLKTFVNLADYRGLFEDRIAFNTKKAQNTVYSAHNQFTLIEKKENRSNKLFTFVSKSFCNLGIQIKKQFIFKSSREIELNIELINKTQNSLSFLYSLCCAFEDVKDTSTIDACNTIFNIYLNNEKKKAMTFFADPGFKIALENKNDLLPTWDINVEKGQVFKINFKASF